MRAQERGPYFILGGGFEPLFRNWTLDKTLCEARDNAAVGFGGPFRAHVQGLSTLPVPLYARENILPTRRQTPLRSEPFLSAIRIAGGITGERGEHGTRIHNIEVTRRDRTLAASQ